MKHERSVQAFAVAAVVGALAGISIAKRKGRVTNAYVTCRLGQPEDGRVSGVPDIGASDPSTQHPFPHDDSLERLSAKILVERIIEVFPDGYLTIIAIIQGAAFGLLFVIASQKLSGHLRLLTNVLVLAQLICGVFVVVAVTHLYLLLTTMLRWRPRISDTLIPYLLGAGELFLGNATGKGASWWLALSAVALAGAFAFWNTKKQMTSGIFENDKMPIYDQQNKVMVRQIYYCLIMSAVSLVIALINLLRISPDMLNIVLTCGIAVIAITIMWLGQRAQDGVYDAYGIPRRRAKRR